MLSALLTAALAFPVTLEIALFLTAALHLLQSIIAFFARPSTETPASTIIRPALASLAGAILLGILVPLPLLALYPFAGKIFAIKALSLTVGLTWLIHASLTLSHAREPSGETFRAFLTGAGVGLHSRSPLISIVVDSVRLAVYSTWAFRTTNFSELRGTGLALIAIGIGISIGAGVFSHRYRANLQRLEALCLFAVSIAIILGWTDR